MEFNNPSNQTVDIVKNYINLKIDIVLLSVSQKMSNAASIFVFAIIMGFIALFISLFISLSLSSWIANELNMPGMGNLIVSLIYIFIGSILYIYRRKLILGPVQRNMSKAMDFSDLHNKSSISKHQSIDESIVILKDELMKSEESFEDNLLDIKKYYSFEQLKERFVESIFNNPKSILSTLLILREVIKNRKTKKQKKKQKM